MKIIKNLALYLILGCFLSVSAQEKNELLDRDFWNGNPDLALVKEKVAKGNDPSEFTDNAFDPVVMALFGGADTEVIKYLIDQEGNDVNKKTHDSRTYIFWAASANNTEVMRYLLEQGASLDVRDSHNYSPAAFAANGGQTNPEIYNLFEEYGVTLADEKTESGANLILLLAPSLESMDQVTYFAEKGIDPKSTDAAGNGIFNYASRKGNTDFLQELVDSDYDYKTLNNNGGNAFLFAAQGSRGHTNELPLFQYLDGLGLDPTVVTNEGETPLHSLASRSKELEVFQFFIDAGAPVNQEDSEGNTPLLNASGRNSLEVIKLLAKNSQNTTITNDKGQSPLMLSTQSNSPEVVSFFMDNSENPSKRVDEDGNSLSYYLINGYNTRNTDNFMAKLKLLQENNISLNTVQQDGNTALHLAAKTNDLDLVKEVSSWDIPLNAKNDEGLTALHIAAMKAHDNEVLKYLVTQGADKSIKTDFEESPYDLASENELLKENEVSLQFLN